MNRPLAACALILLTASPLIANAASTGKYGEGFTFDSQRNLNVNVRAGGSGGGGGGSGAVYPAPSSSPFPVTGTVGVTGSVTVTNQPTPPATQAVTGTINLGAPVDFTPATLNIPSPLPAFISSSAAVPVPVTTPNPAGASPFSGLSVNAQLIGTDGTQYFPVLVEGGTGSLIVTTGGAVATYIAGGSTAGSIVRFGRGRLNAIHNISQTDQTNSFSCYDTLTGIGVGNPLFVGTLKAREIVKIDIPVQTGIFCQSPSGLNSGLGVQVLWQ